LDTNTFKQLLHRYLSGNTTDHEKKTIDTWYESYREPDDAEVFGSEQEATRIREAIHAEVAPQWAPGKRLPIRPYLSYAAAILVMVGFSWLIFQQQEAPTTHHAAQTGSSPVPSAYRTVETAVSQVKKLTLPDSSVVWVNAMSTLRIPESFGKPTRALFLDEGEAYFEVASNPEKPFVVYSHGLSTRVLGTAFNVNAYQRLGAVSITVTHGKVAVADSNQHPLAPPLAAAQQLVYHTASGNHTLAEGVPNTTASWREGITHLRNATFKSVALAFYNTYGVVLQAGNQDIHDHRYSLVIRTTNRPDETARIICSIHQHQFRRKGNEIIIY